MELLELNYKKPKPSPTTTLRHILKWCKNNYPWVFTAKSYTDNERCQIACDLWAQLYGHPEGARYG